METKQTTVSPSLWALIAAPGLAFVLGFLFIYWTDTPWYLASGGVGFAILLGTLAGVLMYLLLIGFSRLPTAQSLKDIMAQLQPMFSDMSVIHVIILSLMAGIGEEVFFRGFLQTWLAGFIGIQWAIVVGAIGFGLLHFASLGYFLITTVIGIVLGVFYHLAESLVLVIVWHSVYDAIAIWVISRYPELLGIEP
jgi:membrane protease YdiL (CAAX protease family)